MSDDSYANSGIIQWSYCDFISQIDFMDSMYSHDVYNPIGWYYFDGNTIKSCNAGQSENTLVFRPGIRQTGSNFSLVNAFKPERVDCDNSYYQSTDKDLCINNSIGNRAFAQLGAGAACEADCKNPVQMVTGNKFDTAVDYADPTGGGLSFIRYYNSYRAQAFETFVGGMPLRAAAHPGIFSPNSGWTHNFLYRVQSVVQNGSYIKLIRPDGAIWAIGDISDSSLIQADGVFDSIRDANGQLQGYMYDNLTDCIEFYDATGRIFALKYYNGLELYITDDVTTGNVTVTNNRGKSLFINAASATVTLPTGNTLNYTLDSGFSGAITAVSSNGQPIYSYGYKANGFSLLTTKNAAVKTLSSWNYFQPVTNKLYVASSSSVFNQGSHSSIISYPNGFDTQALNSTSTSDGASYTVVDTDEYYTKTYTLKDIAGKRVRTGLSVACKSQDAVNGCVSYTENTVHDSQAQPIGRANSKEGFLTCIMYAGKSMPSRIIDHLPISLGVSACSNINSQSSDSVVSAYPDALVYNYQYITGTNRRILQAASGPGFVTTYGYEYTASIGTPRVTLINKYSTPDYTGALGIAAMNTATAVKSYQYTYDNTGLVLQAIENGVTSNYSYSSGALTGFSSSTGESMQVGTVDVHGLAGTFTDQSGLTWTVTRDIIDPDMVLSISNSDAGTVYSASYAQKTPGHLLLNTKVVSGDSSSYVFDSYSRLATAYYGAGTLSQDYSGSQIAQVPFASNYSYSGILNGRSYTYSSDQSSVLSIKSN